MCMCVGVSVCRCSNCVCVDVQIVCVCVLKGKACLILICTTLTQVSFDELNKKSNVMWNPNGKACWIHTFSTETNCTEA